MRGWSLLLDFTHVVFVVGRSAAARSKHCSVNYNNNQRAQKTARSKLPSNNCPRQLNFKRFASVKRLIVVGLVIHNCEKDGQFARAGDDQSVRVGGGGGRGHGATDAPGSSLAL